MPAEVLQGDCVEVMREWEDGVIDAIVCDPPYGLEFMGKEFDRLGDGERMQGWHRAWAEEALRVLKPGGYLLAFGGSRTYHRLACAIEDAGFEIRDCVMWLYGSGFPKSLDVSKAIDKIDRVGPMEARARQFTAWMRSTGITAQQINEITGTFMGSHYTTDKSQPSVATADLFDKLRPYLPAVPAEIEELVRSRTIEIENMKRRKVVGERAVPVGHAFAGEVYGREGSASAIVPITLPYSEDAQRWAGWGTALKPAHEPIVVARKPLIGTVAANVLRHGTGALNIDGCRVGTENTRRSNVESIGYGGSNRPFESGSDSGRWPANVIHDGSEEVLAGFPVTTSGKPGIMRKGINDGAAYGAESRPPGTPMSGFGDSGSAARFYYCAKASKAEREAGLSAPAGKRANVHPTVKPVALMKYLLRLVLPPGGIALDPFAGSGTTLVAAAELGMTAIGIERDPAYVEIAAARVQAAEARAARGDADTDADTDEEGEE
jgi:DNA modification methylase